MSETDKETHSPARWRQEMQISPAIRKWTSSACLPSVCVQSADFAYPVGAQQQQQVTGRHDVRLVFGAELVRGHCSSQSTNDSRQCC